MQTILSSRTPITPLYIPLCLAISGFAYTVAPSWTAPPHIVAPGRDYPVLRGGLLPNFEKFFRRRRRAFSKGWKVGKGVRGLEG